MLVRARRIDAPGSVYNDGPGQGASEETPGTVPLRSNVTRGHVRPKDRVEDCVTMGARVDGGSESQPHTKPIAKEGQEIGEHFHVRILLQLAAFDPFVDRL